MIDAALALVTGQITALESELEEVTRFLLASDQRLRGDGIWYQNYEFARRFALLDEYLEAAKSASDAGREVAALSLLRPSMELVMRDAFQFRRALVPAKHAFPTAEDADQAISMFQEGLRDGFAWVDERDSSVVHYLLPVISKGSDGQERLPVVGAGFVRYNDWFRLDAALRRKHFRPHVSTYIGEGADQREQQSYYRAELGWGTALGHLVRAGVYSAADVERIQIHYAFLSQFIHPIGDVRRLLGSTGFEQPWVNPSVRLAVRAYAIALTAMQTETLMHLVALQPNVRLLDADRYEAILNSPRLLRVMSALGLPGASQTVLDDEAESQARTLLDAQRAMFSAREQRRRGYLRLDERPHLDSNPVKRLLAHAWRGLL